MGNSMVLALGGRHLKAFLRLQKNELNNFVQLEQKSTTPLLPQSLPPQTPCLTARKLVTPTPIIIYKSAPPWPEDKRSHRAALLLGVEGGLIVA